MKFRAIIFGISLGFLAVAGRGSSISLTEAQRAKLAALVRDEPEAAALFVDIRKTADGALKDEPNPIAVILTQGKLATDPVKHKTWQSLDDMWRIAALGNAWAVTNNQKYADKIREYLLAWAAENHSAGDPIDDTNLDPLITAYDLIRETLNAADRKTIDQYLRGIAEVEIRTGMPAIHTNINNWNSHRLKIVGLIAFTLQDSAMIEHTVKAFHKQVQDNLLSDGSSIDFHERDALHYHEYDVRPLVTLAIAARDNGWDFYDYHAASGSSLAASVAFLIPYADGRETHAEFVNSTVAFDRKRAEAGQREFEPGRLFEPRNALPSLEMAELFDPSLLPLVKHLADSKAERFPTWQIVLNAVQR